MDKVGSKVGPPPTAQERTFEVRAAPADLPDNHGVKDAERLKHVTSPTLVQAERQWLEKLQAKHPDRVLEKAVKGMLPKGPLGYAMIKKMKVYAGTEHPHAAQQPKPLEI